MTDPDNTGSDNTDNDGREGLTDEPRARFRGTRWPGLIWAVPVVAAAIVLWLGFTAFNKSGPTVTVDFPTTGGFKPDSTKVKYRGVNVGYVASVKLSKSLDRMTVKLHFDSDMDGHLGAGTEFWVAGQSVDFNNLSSLKSIVAGPFIGMAPQPGKTVDHFVSLDEPPVIPKGAQGKTLTVIADQIGNLSRGASVFFNHFPVGKVVRLTMAPDGRSFTITAFINKKYENLVTTSSRFWDAGAVSVKLGGSGPSLMLESVPALITGALSFETPPGGQAVTETTRFHLYPSENAARTAPGPHAVPYRIVLAGGPHGLATGAAVKLEGADVGTVTGVAMHYDPASGRISTRIDIVLEPDSIPLAPPHDWNLANPTPQMNAMLATLISRGLRARMASSTPVVGGKIIELDMVKGAAPAGLGAGSPPEIPSVPGSSVNRIMAQVSTVLANIQDATGKIAAVSN
ncbi:MAG TPA: MlaD family protein, partial [Acidiphilium sp.]